MASDNFKDLLNSHLNLVHNDLRKVSDEINKRSNEHDLDKIFNKELYDLYDEHFPKLKQFEYGTEEYFDYERTHMQVGHKIHGKQRHHFYSKHNEIDDINLIDLIEAVVDISCSARQYNNEVSTEIVMNSIKSKKLEQYDLEKLIENTINFLEENND